VGSPIQTEARLAAVRQLLKEYKIRRQDESYVHLTALTGQDLGDSLSLAQLALRPGVTPQTVSSILSDAHADVTLTDLETALADHLYSGYLETQTSTIRRLHQHDSLRVPTDFTFTQVGGLSHEIVERLERAQPRTFGQARKIPGMTPAALSNLLVHLTAAAPQSRRFT